MSKHISILLRADLCRHCRNWPCLLSQRRLHIPYHHSNSSFPDPRVSVRAAASEMLNNADLLLEGMNGAVMGLSLQHERYTLQHKR